MTHLLSILETVLAVAAVLTLLAPVFKSKRQNALIDLLTRERDEYKQIMEDHDARHVDEIKEILARHERETQANTKKIAEMDGRISFLTDKFADSIADKVAARVAEVVNG